MHAPQLPTDQIEVIGLALRQSSKKTCLTQQGCWAIAGRRLSDWWLSTENAGTSATHLCWVLLCCDQTSFPTLQLLQKIKALYQSVDLAKNSQNRTDARSFLFDAAHAAATAAPLRCAKTIEHQVAPKAPDAGICAAA
jgi:hypothetical protein